MQTLVFIQEKLRIVQAYHDKIRVTEIARVMGHKVGTISQIIQKYLKTGEVVSNTQRRGGTKPKKLNNDQIAVLQGWIDDDCSISLKKISEKCLREFDIHVAPSTLHAYIKEFNYSLKRVQIIPERRNAESNLEVRQEYANRFTELQMELYPDTFIFLDEVDFNVSLRVNRSRSKIGTPATQTVASIRSRNISICCAMSRNGILAHSSRNGAFNTEAFLQFLEEIKIKIDEKEIENPIIFMENVAFHKSRQVHEFAEANNIQIKYIPPYSPFLKPIENMFSKWKNTVCRARPTNEDQLMEAIREGATLVTIEDCKGYYKNILKYIRKCSAGQAIVD